LRKDVMINFGIMNFELRLTPWLVSPRANELKILPATTKN
jgi:hypothetical protein